MIAGGITGGINICIIFPTEFIKTTLQLDSRRNIMSAHYCIVYPFRAIGLQTKIDKDYIGSIDVVKKTISERGIRGMYRGITASLFGVVPTYAVR